MQTCSREGGPLTRCLQERRNSRKKRLEIVLKHTTGLQGFVSHEMSYFAFGSCSLGWGRRVGTTVSSLPIALLK